MKENPLFSHISLTYCSLSSGNAFALFLKSQRKWENPPLQYGHKAQFKALAAEHRYDAARYGFDSLALSRSLPLSLSVSLSH